MAIACSYNGDPDVYAPVRTRHCDGLSRRRDEPARVLQPQTIQTAEASNPDIQVPPSHSRLYRSHLYRSRPILVHQMRSFIRQFIAAASAVISISAAQAQSVGVPVRVVAHAARATGPIRLDGVLDEAAWQSAPVIRDFKQSYPNPGAPPVDSTHVRVLYDNNALYVGVRMFDSEPSKIAAQLARRDATGIYSDWVHLVIGTYHDRRTAFRFSVNPLGVKKDVLEYNDNNEDVNWDAVWDVATRIDSLGWTAEYRIPFSQLRFPATEPAGGRVWDFQIQRDIARRQERDSWAPWTVQSPGYVSSFGTLEGLRGIPAPERLEIAPYTSARLTRAPGTSVDPFFRSNDTKLAVGADIRYGLPNGLTLTGTVNPDFGQVEVDPAVVNLSAFETFFPEKRPFFLEGNDIFQFGNIRTHNDYGNMTYFYTRRVGRQPQRAIGGSDIAYVAAPDQTTILGAGKLTGRVGPWTVGTLDAVTGEQTARFATTEGIRGTAPVEPLTNYFAGRAQRQFRDGNTVLGGMITATDRSLGDSVLASTLRRGAYFGGGDFEHAWDNRNWIASGYAAGSLVRGTPSAITATQRSSARYFQRPDAGYVHLDTTRTSLGGYTAQAAIDHEGPIVGSLTLKEVSPGFEINDAGFESRADYRALSSLIGYGNQTPGAHLRSYDVFTFSNLSWTYGGAPVARDHAIGWDATFNNLWQVGGKAILNTSVYDARLTRGGPLVRIPRSEEENIYITSDSRYPVTGMLMADYLHDQSGASTLTNSLTLDARPASFVHVSFGPTVTTQRSTDQYVRTVTDPLATATYGRRYVFANLKQTTLSLDTRVDWTFTPTLTLQLYAQPFVSAGTYTSFKQLRAPRTYDFDVYGSNAGSITPGNSGYTVDPDGVSPAPPFTLANPDFNVRSLHGDAVLRWEYRPGSALFLVWQQERNDFQQYGDFALSRDAGAVFRTVPTNVFLVKLAYWFGK